MKRSLFLVARLLVGAALWSSTAFAHAPANDLFAAPQTLSGISGNLSIALEELEGAGAEDGEPLHAGVGGVSVWYQWTAPASGAVVFDTTGSGFDTILAVYVGENLANAVSVAANDNTSGVEDGTSRVVFPVVTGATYRLALVGQEGSLGTAELNWQTFPAGLVQFAHPEFKAFEDEGGVVVTVTRAPDAATGATVNYETVNGTAIDGENYYAASGVLTFAPGQTSATFPVQFIDNSETGDRELTVKLTSAGENTALGELIQATVIIDDDEDAPVNDKFANARLLEGETGFDSGSNAGARLQAGEPNHGSSNNSSVWYKWVAPANGVAVFETTGSTDVTAEPLDTLLAVYTGTALNGLTPVVKNDNAQGTVTSRVSFSVKSGVTYSIAVAGKNGAEGGIELAWSFGAGGRYELSQADYRVSEKGGLVSITVKRFDGSTAAATIDVLVEGLSAFEEEDYTVGTLPVSFSSGQTSADLKLTILNDSDVEGDETVRIALQTPPEGAILGNITEALLTIDDDDDNPVNDDFAQAIVLDQTGQPVMGTNVGAGREAKEPLHANVQSYHSVWYKWTAPTSGVATFGAAGSYDGDIPLDTLLAVYTGTSVDKLTLVAANDNADDTLPFSLVNFAAKANTTYYIAVDSIGETGEIFLNRNLTASGLVQFLSPVFKGREGTSVTVTVERSGVTTGTASVTCLVKKGENDTASPGSDFTEASVPVSFPAGQTRTTFAVLLGTDSAVEGEESLTLELINPEGVVLANSRAALLIDDINDDPANDNFANAALITGVSGQTAGDNAGAGTETGDTTVTARAGHNIWYKWVAPANGQATFSTDGSGDGLLDTVLTVFTGNSLATLKVVATNDNAMDGVPTSTVHFAALNGTTYYVCVDAAGPFPASTSLNWSVVTGGTLAFSSGVYRADEGAGKVEITVLRQGPNASAASVDYTLSVGTTTDGEDFTATSGTVRFAPGQTLRSFLVPITNDEEPEADESITVTLANPSQGSIVGELSTATVVILDNDTEVQGNQFADALELESGVSGSLSASNAGAGREAGETLPGTLLNSLGSGRTVWFTWKAPTSGQVTFLTDGSTGDNGPLNTVIGVYTGTSLSNLRLVAENDETEAGEAAAVGFKAVAGRIYYIVVDTVGDEAGNIELSWNLEEPEVGPLLAPGSTIKPSISFSESFSEKITGNINDGFETPATVKLSGMIVASMEDIDISSLDENTVVSLSLGEFGLSEISLSESTDYLTNRAAKKNIATFPLKNFEDKTVGTIKFAWDAAKLTITFTCASANEFSIVTAGYDDAAEPIATTIGAEISFAGVKGQRSVYVNGTGRTATTIKDGSEYYTTSVSVTGKADYTAPVVTFKSPADKFRTTADLVDITGTVTDDVLLNWDIFVSVNGSEPINANPELAENQKKGTWSLPEVALEPGINQIQVMATDESGNMGVATRTVVRVVNSPVSIEVVGQGSTKGNFTGTSLEVGKAYSITATPAAGWIFSGWSGDVTASTPKLDFTMIDCGLSLVANFVENPFLALKGKYTGLVQPGLFNPAQTGAFTLDLTPTGGVTGSLNVGGEKLTLKGNFDANGFYTQVFPRKGKSPLVVTLLADLASGSDQITGTITDGTFTSSIVSDRNVFDPKTNPAPQAGTYTAILPATDPLRSSDPFGHGFATVVVSPNGSARVTGNLPDNATLSFSAQLSKTGVLPVYTVIKNSTVAGSVLFGGTPAAGASGTLGWIRTAVTGIPALELELGFEADVFIKPGKNERVMSSLNNGAQASLRGAGYADEVSQNITVGTDNKVVVATHANGGLLTLTIAPAAGTFTGTIRKPGTTKTLTVKGAFLQQSGLGAGYFTDGSASGYFVIEVP